MKKPSIPKTKAIAQLVSTFKLTPIPRLFLIGRAVNHHLPEPMRKPTKTTEFAWLLLTVIWKPLESANITLGLTSGLCTTTCNVAKFRNHWCFPAVVGWDGAMEGKDTVAGSQTWWSQKKTWKFTYR